MDFAEYQARALLTDQVTDEPNRIVVPLLGMAGELGSLMVEYKKYLRDGPAHRLFKEQFAEELGDILWYLSNLASKMKVSLEDIAKSNLEKVAERFPIKGEERIPSKPNFFDGEFLPDERIPHQMRVELGETDQGGKPVITLTVDGRSMGNALIDNSYNDDGYRFHDVFHFAHAAVLGWSPVVRRILGCKRRSRPEIDEIEDGGRARVIDEGIVAFVFDYARRASFFDGVSSIDFSLFKTIRSLTSGLEVKVRTPLEWEKAILDGYSV
jgi:NTP pyrophosphatase (non-canonical NTP hydrolase)